MSPTLSITRPEDLCTLLYDHQILEDFRNLFFSMSSLQTVDDIDQPPSSDLAATKQSHVSGPRGYFDARLFALQESIAYCTECLGHGLETAALHGDVRMMV